MSETKCYRPKGHEGDCGEPISDAEDEDRILYGSCGPWDEPTGVIYAGVKTTWSE